MMSEMDEQANANRNASSSIILMRGKQGLRVYVDIQRPKVMLISKQYTRVAGQRFPVRIHELQAKVSCLSFSTTVQLS